MVARLDYQYVQNRTRYLVLIAFQLANQRFEIPRLAEIAIDRGEANVSDLVQTGQRLHHQFADHVGGNLIFAHGFQAAHDARDHPVHPLALDRALAQRMVDRTFQLVAVESLAAAIFLDHDQFAQLHPLEGGETATAFGTMTPPPDGGIVLRRTTVLYLAVVMSAEGAAHRDLSIDGEALAK